MPFLISIRSGNVSQQYPKPLQNNSCSNPCNSKMFPFPNMFTSSFLQHSIGLRLTKSMQSTLAKFRLTRMGKLGKIHCQIQKKLNQKLWNRIVSHYISQILNIPCTLGLLSFCHSFKYFIKFCQVIG